MNKLDNTRQNANLVGPVLKAVKEVQKARNFPSLSYTVRVLLKERLVELGLMNPEDQLGSRR